ncbi:ABC transporter substrate-binding protein [Oculatella sp. FACHB-28]|uniref:ABC transporter substrate-binding protein n=1 Tax=Oculatella sp. FACHB-28 TaxID=2692845 RepID=UPI001683C2AD|nr:ABC transporter substrate-binding protein [Oculatella sp. FACHB-28]MBD2059574.1 ABC transporter substrate-binding protein [Oculatella sp. FACHB-28]
MLQVSRRLVLIALAALLWVVACSPQSTPPDSATQPLRTGTGIYPGNAGHYVAADQGLFNEEGVNVENFVFQNLGDGITAFLTNKVDVLWASSSDAVQMSNEDPSVKIFYLISYSDGGDGILGRNINRPEDLRGKTIAREDLLFVNVLLRAYLQQGGLTEKDVVLRNMTAADAATAFASKQVDAAVSYGPWLANAAEVGGGEIIFSSKDTNLIADVLITRQTVIEQRAADLQAYLRAIDQGVERVRSGDEEALSSVADALGITLEESKQQLDWVRFLNIEENKRVAFEPNNPDSLVTNLQFTAQAAYDLDITPQQLEASFLYDDSVVKSL